tara:strand:- start:83416 stop:83766 length:351 start_codon:yes stop_codon:yes gene_type:complete
MKKELKVLVEQLCDDLTNAMHEKWEHSRGVTTHNYSVGQKYIRIFSVEDGQPRSAWGFINKKEFQKGATGITFKEGDVLKCAGWNTPALNAPRGNLFQGYEIYPNSMRLYGPDYLR